MQLIGKAGAVLLGIWMGAWMDIAQAEVMLRDFSPQGEVRDANRATAVFSGDMVKLGATDADAPFTIECSVAGTGRWSDPHTWTYSLSRDLNPGERCSFTPKPGLKALDGSKVYARGEFRFFAPGPWIQRIEPYQNAKIEEDQVFFINSRMPVTPESVKAHAWCEVEGVGERIPVQLLSRQELQSAAYRLNIGFSDTTTGLTCSQRLPPGTRMRLIWGKGIQTSTGSEVLEDDAVTYEVRVPFRAELTCERERADMPCSALSDLRLQFTDQVSIDLAEKIRLIGPKGEISPRDVSMKRKTDLMALSPKLFYLKNRLVDRDYIDTVVFRGPFVPDTPFTIKLPEHFVDLSGRPLTNAASFPLKTRVGRLPPLAKFAADFGILERKEGGILPVTLRNVESKLNMRVLRQTNGKDMIATLQSLAQFEQQTTEIPPPARPHISKRDLDGDEDTTPSPTVDTLYPRELSFLADNAQASQQALPKPGGTQPFEVVGIPLQKPGFYVVEVESNLLGASLLRYPAAMRKPMYVRSQVLVTDMAVHLKKGRDNSLIWVTSLSSGKPVSGARVELFACDGSSIWQSKTDQQGRALMAKSIPEIAHCYSNEVFATATLGDDFSFVRSTWDRGIESWRFNANTWNRHESPKIHTILDRTLLRAGETVSMKHIARILHADGYRYPLPQELPASMTIELQGGDYSISLPLKWDQRGIATASWKIPDAAKLGTYSVRVGGGWQSEAEFRVSEFRLPVYKGSVQAAKSRFAHPDKIPLQLSLAYLNGGSASGQDVTISAMLKPSYLFFPRYYQFSFGPDSEWEEPSLVADGQEVKLDKHGTAKLDLPLGAQPNRPATLLTEMTFSDPGGEVHTLSGETDIWPAAVAVGAQVKDWAGLGSKREVQVVALDLAGNPMAGVPIKVSGERQWEFVHRKRIIGGFYSYETDENSEDLGTLCSGNTNALGLFECTIEARDEGHIKLAVEGQDKNGQVSLANTGFWVSASGETWFEQEDQDRMDVIPEKREYMPGDKARFQIHTPFHEATALIAVEREGVVQSFVQPLYRREATIEIPVGANWGPNVYVSVLAVRGRLTQVPWYSFFQWGWHAPKEWYMAWRSGPPQATALVDLAKPAYKYGLTRIDVGNAGVKLKVDVTADKPVYQPRAKARVSIQVRLPNGKPAPAGSEVAVAAIDRALLELAPNTTWNLLEDMQQERAYLVETSTAQMQVVGKRHYGKKALPAGGGGGQQSSRELFDTLLYWNPRVKLDREGKATVDVPLNDSLTAFKLVAIADVGTSYFGTGETEITSTQDMQIMSGLPPLVREGDRYRAMLTLRNTTSKPMTLKVTGRSGSQPLAMQSVTLDPESAREVAWLMKVPGETERLSWLVEARNADGKLMDSIKLTQKVLPRVPVTLQQATFMQLEKPYAVPADLPAGALPGKGGIEVRLSASLAGQMTGVRRYFEEYPYSCLEQKVSIASGLADAKRWDDIRLNLAGYLDNQGFLQYFPGAGRGSEALTSYVLTMAYEQHITLSQEAESHMRKALLDFVEGRATPATPWLWGNRQYQTERKLIALAALSYTDAVQARMLTPYEFKPQKMATTTLLDWYTLLKHVSNAPDRSNRLQAIERELRNRMQYVGGRLVFTTEQDDFWWWLMVDGEINAVRLATLAMDDPAWQADMPAMIRGALLRQRQGHWSTTIANVWGSLALQRFAARFEHDAVAGTTRASLSGKTQQYAWPAAANTTQPQANTGGDEAQLALPWPVGTAGEKTPMQFKLTHEGSGKPWASVMVSAAIPGRESFNGYHIQRTVSPLEQKIPGQWSRGDLARVRVDVTTDQSMSWVVLSDPIPGGASILGNTARDSAIAQERENDWRDGRNDAWPIYTERGLGFFRAYYEYVPKGVFWYEYTIRLNNPGEFSLPPTRVEAMYAPEMFGQLPNEPLEVLNQ